jgi:hypothetical protein
VNILARQESRRQQQLADRLKDAAVDMQRFVRQLVEEIVQRDVERHRFLPTRGAVLPEQFYAAVVTEPGRDRTHRL